MTRKGIIGAIILGLIVLAIVLIFFAGTVMPFLQKAPETGQKTLYSLQGIEPEPYYDVIIDSSKSYRGHLEFSVLDPEADKYVTDFPFPSAFEGFSVSEDNNPRRVQSVSLYRNLYIATAFEGKLAFGDCNTSYLEKMKGIPFNNTHIGFFPGEGFTGVCSDTKQNYLQAVKDATYALPAGGDNYNALVIIADGDCTISPDCDNGSEEYDELIGDAAKGLNRQDVQTALIFTTNVANCVKDGSLINFTRGALGISAEQVIDANTGAAYYKSPDGRRRCEGISDSSYENLATTLLPDVAKIKLNYVPYAGEDGVSHTIAVRATKKPYMGRNEIEIIYGVA